MGITMSTTCFSMMMLFAEASEPVKDQPAAGGVDQLLMSFLPFILIGILFYFMLIRPQRKEQSKRQDMLSNIKKNDRVVTVGGIYGVVMNVHREADEVTVKVDEGSNTKLKLTLSSIARVLGDETSDGKSSEG
jgi:preprotein translocase subunit YajC